MMYFGEVFGCPLDMERIDTPTMAPCARCGEYIRSSDDGFAVPVMGEPLLAAYHRACFMRGIIGSVAHQEKRCSCFGGTGEDDPNLTMRQAAEAAVKLWEGN